MSTSKHFWESFYSSGESRWSGKPNPSLVAEVADLAPGSALDLGCGQGGDAIWLASRGWSVTAADISTAALSTAARNAAAAGLADAIAWERHDLAVSVPGGAFDLVAVAYLHSPVELDRTRILRAAAEAVAPGGTLVVVGHAPSPSHPQADLPSPQQVVEDLALPPGQWRLRTSELSVFEHAFAGETPTERTDSVVRLQRAR